jgi:hypothetical protein
MRPFVAIVLSSTLVLQAVPVLVAQAIPQARARAARALAAPGALGGTPQAPPLGAITGMAQNTAGEVLPRYSVHVRNLQTGQLVGTTTSNAEGAFSFANLVPGNYVIELVNSANLVVGTSASIAVGAGATSSAAVALAAGTAAVAGGAGGGLTTVLIVAGIAGAAGITGAIVVARDASPSR